MGKTNALFLGFLVLGMACLLFVACGTDGLSVSRQAAPADDDDDDVSANDQPGASTEVDLAPDKNADSGGDTDTRNGVRGWAIDAVLMDNGYLAVLYAAAPQDSLVVNGLALFDEKLNFVEMNDVGLDFPHTLDRDGNTLLISDSGNGRLVLLDPFTDTVSEIVVDANGNFIWPNDADFTDDGNIVFSDLGLGTIYKITPDGEILWSRSMLDLLGDGNDPMAIELHDPDELPNGNLLFCLSAINTVYEVDTEDNVVWSYQGDLIVPKSAQRLANGNTLIGSLFETIEVTPAGEVVWRYQLPEHAGMNAERYADGNTLLGTTHVRLVAPDGTVIWDIMPATEKSKAADDPNHRQMLLLRSIGYL